MSRPADHYCAVCRFAVDRHSEPGRADEFRHVPSADHWWTGPQHEPQPVPMAELVLRNQLCDICSDLNPVLAYLFPHIKVVTLDGDGATHTDDLGEWWLICKACSQPTDAGDIAGMIDRAREAWRRRGQSPPAGLGRELQSVYRAMRHHVLARVPTAEVFL
jgi:hypothetical protein